MRALIDVFARKTCAVVPTYEKTRDEIELEQTRKELQETKDELKRTEEKLLESTRSVEVLQADNKNLRDTINGLTAEVSLSIQIDSVKDKVLKEQVVEISVQSDVISKLRKEKAALLCVNALMDLKCSMLHMMIATLEAMESVAQTTTGENPA